MLPTAFLCVVLKFADNKAMLPANLSVALYCLCVFCNGVHLHCCTIAHLLIMCYYSNNKKRGEKMARLNANIDDCTYVELKKMAVEKRTSITAIVSNLITEYLCEQTNNKTAQKNKKRGGIDR